MSRLSLNAKVNKLFDGNAKASVYGLSLLVECIHQTAKDRNWDALSTFVTRAEASSQGRKVKQIIRLAFGDALVYKTDKKHPTGGVFVMGWEGEFNLRGRNAFLSAIADAERDGLGWDSKAFAKAVNVLAPAKDKTKEQKVRSSEETTKKANTILKAIDDAVAMGFSKADLMALINKAVANGTVKLVD